MKPRKENVPTVGNGRDKAMEEDSILTISSVAQNAQQSQPINPDEPPGTWKGYITPNGYIRPRAVKLLKGNSLAEKILTFSDLLSWPENIEWLVDQIIPKRATGVLAGRYGIGKTWSLLDLAICMAIGKAWLDKFDVTKGNVLLIDEESSEPLLKSRLEFLSRAHGLDDIPKNIFWLVGSGWRIPPLGKNDETDVKNPHFVDLRTIIQELQIDLVILDSLRRFHALDENSSQAAHAIFAPIREMIRQTGTSVLSAHHFNKYARGGADRIRGSVDIIAVQDWALTMELYKDGFLRMAHVKARMGEQLFGGEDGGFKVKMDLKDAKTAPFTFDSALTPEEVADAKRSILYKARDAICDYIADKGDADGYVDKDKAFASLQSRAGGAHKAGTLKRALYSLRDDERLEIDSDKRPSRIRLTDETLTREQIEKFDKGIAAPSLEEKVKEMDGEGIDDRFHD